jgi:hypothetical protein
MSALFALLRALLRRSSTCSGILASEFHKVLPMFDTCDTDTDSSIPLAQRQQITIVTRAELSRLTTVLVSTLLNGSQTGGASTDSLQTACLVLLQNNGEQLLRAPVWVILNRPNNNDFNVTDAWFCLGQLAHALPLGAVHVCSVLLDPNVQQEILKTAKRGSGEADGKVKHVKDNAIMALIGVLDHLDKGKIKAIEDEQKEELKWLQKVLTESRYGVEDGSAGPVEDFGLRNIINL